MRTTLILTSFRPAPGGGAEYPPGNGKKFPAARCKSVLVLQNCKPAHGEIHCVVLHFINHENSVGGPLRNTCVPPGPGRPLISSTKWRRIPDEVRGREPCLRAA